MTKRISFLMVISFLILGNSCGDKNNKDFLVTIETPYGDIKAILYDETPLHKANFINLASTGQYDSTIFHRVMQGFMVQGGGIDMKNGTTSDQRIKAEFVEKYHHKKGALAAARQPDQVNPNKESSYCQFYIVQGEKYTAEQLSIDQNKFNNYVGQYLQLEKNQEILAELQALYQSGDRKAYFDKIYSLVPDIERDYQVSLKIDYPADRLASYTTIGGTPSLDDEYTVFGEVVEGLQYVDSIAAQRVNAAMQHRPLQDIFMKVSVEEISKKKITKDYGYVYPEPAE